MRPHTPITWEYEDAYVFYRCLMASSIPSSRNLYIKKMKKNRNTDASSHSHILLLLLKGL